MTKKNVNNKELGFEKCTIFFLKPRNAQTKLEQKGGSPCPILFNLNDKENGIWV